MTRNDKLNDALLQHSPLPTLDWRKKSEAGEATSLIQSDAPETFSEPWGMSAKGVDDLLMFVFLTSPVDRNPTQIPTFSWLKFEVHRHGWREWWCHRYDGGKLFGGRG